MTVYRVDSTRPDDTGDGTSWATAKKTAQAGLDLLAIGDNLWLGSNAAHVLSATLTFPSLTTTRLLPVSVEGRNPVDDSRAKAEIDLNGGAFTAFTSVPNFTIFQNLEIHANSGANSLLSFSTTWCRVIDCEIHDSNNASAHGLVVGSKAEIINTIVWDIQGIGILPSTAGAWTAYGCLLHTITDDAIRTGSVDARIISCRFRNNDAHNIFVSADDALIRFNSIVGKDAAGDDGIHYSAGVDGGDCIGNIIQDCDVGIEYNTTGGPIMKGHNVFFSNGTNEANAPANIVQVGDDLAVDPQFKNLASNDFTIKNLALRQKLFDIGLHYGASQAGGIQPSIIVRRGGPHIRM